MANKNNLGAPSKLAPWLLFQRFPTTIAGTAVTFPFMDLGLIEERSHKTETDSETFMDDRATGLLQALSIQENSYVRTLELTTPSISLDLLAMYYRAGPPAAPSPAMNAGSGSAVAISLFSGSPAQIVDANGNDVVNVTAVSSLLVNGGTAAVFNVDYTYTPYSLSIGVIYTLPASTLITGAAATPATISYTTAGLTGNVQFIPGGGACSLSGMGKIFYTSCGQRVLRERGMCTIQIPDLALDPKKAARIKPLVTMLYDPTLGTANDVTAISGYG